MGNLEVSFFIRHQPFMEDMAMRISYLQKTVAKPLSFLFIGSFFLAGYAEGITEKQVTQQKEPFTTPFTAPKAGKTVKKVFPDTKPLGKTPSVGISPSLRKELAEQKRIVAQRDAEIESNKEEIKALKRELRNTKRVLAMEHEKSESKFKDEITDLNKELTSLHADLKKSQMQVKTMRQKQAAIEAEKASFQKESGIYRDMIMKAFPEEIQKGIININEDQGILTLTAQNVSFFGSGSASPNEQGQALLARLSEVLKKAPDREIQVEGYTDSDKISGILMDKYATNWELSSARATSVVRYLIDKTGMDPMRMGAVGYGESHPIASNATAEGKALNRRVNIVLLPLKK
jgi:chemotaxis protein MotB